MQGLHTKRRPPTDYRTQAERRRPGKFTRRGGAAARSLCETLNTHAGDGKEAVSQRARRARLRRVNLPTRREKDGHAGRRVRTPATQGI
ncbi:MAG: hypothetical protein AMS14_02310 [Planctomycetes bacterium DG_20]|nr:MAG: hypothetical protein AMS14_02310 [Planctomycetes bacterium DG_20]